ncbi:type I polyketide synthase [Okeania sp. KiyG1]|uniref:type I polyketide synthase n=1 Tax=Okeania sp. KiyG1 TaxID=2720165 RepID=UPI001922D71E|nr:type I polyketide synthase [Okeania sp. KiyG1]GFZ92541.1 hypothetical protein CYANOKiyG1_03220 [Okeania sp. KiyG1]
MENPSEYRNTTNSLSATKRALIALKEMQSELQALKSAQTEPIAIIGMSCRLPGEADSPEAFWDLLQNGIDAIAEVPLARWNINDYYDPDPDTPGKMVTRNGGFLSQVDRFDAAFFGISPREAQSIDPQQRLLLEVSWEALERSHIVPDDLCDSFSGVFIGTASGDYLHELATNEIPQGYWGTGNSRSAVAGRLSYLLGLTGPSLAVDTACSSSLVSVHLACQSLRKQECNLALAGGVDLILSPEISIIFSKAKMLSPDGRCKTFDASANGFARGEGCGIIVLKRLSDALANGDNILAVIRGSAVNQNGASGGLTVPSGPSQVVAIRTALKNGGVDPADVSYVEAHGTGTSLGDPIEVGAIGTVFGKTHSQEEPLIIGSAKTNIGHLEGAAGIAGLIKIVLQLQHQQIAPSLHFNQPNPLINWSQLPLQVSTQLTPWPTNGKSRIAGVSSFGFSGINSHVILEEAPVKFKSQNSKVKIKDVLERPVHLLTLSAKTEKALTDLVSNYQNHLKKYPQLKLADICHTANTGRTHFQHRLAVVASNQAELLTKLQKYQEQEELVGIYSGKQADNTTVPKIAFLFTGQGSQYLNMGRQLYERAPIFREAIHQCEQILSSVETFQNQSLGELLYPTEQDESNLSLLDQTAYTQPALFAIEYALFKLWESWGIKPDAVMGHSVGEYVAATVAGVFSLEDGLKLIAARGKLMQQLPSGGEMVSVMASASKIQETLREMALEEKVAIAAINGPQSTVISGESEGIRVIVTHLESEGIKTKALQVSHAFHSPLMEPMLAEFEAVAKQLTYNQPYIPLISNLSGLQVDSQITTAEYWVNHIRQPVQFDRSMRTLHEQGYEVFLEIGAKPILLGMGRQCLPEEIGVWLPSLRPGKIPLPSPLESPSRPPWKGEKPEDTSLLKDGKPEDTSLLRGEWQQMLSSLGQLYVQGANVNWSGLDRDYTRQKVLLPNYPFQRERYWVENKQKFQKQQRVDGKNVLHPLLGRKLHIAALKNQYCFESFVAGEQPAYLKHHEVFSQVVFPGTGYLEIAASAGVNLFNSQDVLIEDVVFCQGLIIPKSEFKTVQTVLQPLDNDSYKFEIFSLDNQENPDTPLWVLHTEGKIRLYSSQTSQTKIDIEQYKAECNQPIEAKEHYQKNRQLGLNHGISFQGVQELWSGSNQALGLIKLPERLTGETKDYHFHPALLDAAVQVIYSALSKTNNNLYLPVELEEFKMYARPGIDLWAYASATDLFAENKTTITTEVTITNLAGELIATVKGLKLQLATQQALKEGAGELIANWFYEVKWRKQKISNGLLSPDSSPTPLNVEQKRWLILADKQGIAQHLATKLRSLGDVCTLVFVGDSDRQISRDEFTVNPQNSTELEQLVATVAAQSPSLYGVVQCWTAEAGLGENISSDELGNLSKLGCGTTLSLVQALAKAEFYEAPRLWLVTLGSQPVPSSHPVIPGVAQSSLWAMGKVIILEHPELNCARIDLDPRETIQNQVNTLFHEISSEDREDQVAWRGESRYVPRLNASPHRQADAKSLNFRQDATYLITGGLGALGLLIAPWMMDKGAKHLVLVGRRSPDEAVRKKLTELELAGAEVVVEQADVSVLESMTKVLRNIEHSKRPLAGIIHLAGSISDGFLLNQNWSNFERVMAPKVQGSWYLHELTQNQPLDFFVLFSSVASLLGTPGQGNYAAANGFLDGLVHYRRAMGLPALSIHWGPISQVGMAAESGADVRAQKYGVGSITPTQVLEYLELLMSSTDDTEIGVVPIEWLAWAERVAEWSFLADWQELVASIAATKREDDSILQELKVASSEQRYGILTDYIVSKIANILAMSASQIDVDQPIIDMGLDSLMAGELRNLLKRQLGEDIPFQEIFGGASTAQIADVVNEKITQQLLLEEITDSGHSDTQDEDMEEIIL